MGRPGIVTDGPVALLEHELLSRVFRTLGNPTRLQLLEALLEAGEATQSDLLERVEASQSRVSEHLACLTWCGLVTSRRDGRVVHYRIADEDAGEFLRLARSFVASNEAAVGSCTVLDTGR